MTIHPSKFEATFGAPRSGRRLQSVEPQERAQLWLNIGYSVQLTPDAPATFVALPIGIPLDTMKPVETRSSNEEWALTQHLRNEFLSDILEQASALPPGGEVIIACENSDMAIQIRRVKEETPPAYAPGERIIPKRVLFELNKAA